MARRRKCKTCGNSFEPKGPDDFFCSQLCRTAGCFVGGGGDTRKPLSPEQKKALEKKGIDPSSQPAEEPKKRVRMTAEKYPRVQYMFTLPIEERYAVSREFTKEEAEYARRLAKKMLVDERKFDEVIDWDYDGGEQEKSGRSYEGITGGSLGDSDDGTI